MHDTLHEGEDRARHSNADPERCVKKKISGTELQQYTEKNIIGRTIPES